MKKLLIALLVLAGIIAPAVAKETITIVYSWTASDPAANYDRTIIEEANRIQNKYTFVFDAKPGAGGSVASAYILNTPNTIQATSSAFFIRPNFYPNESHDIANYREVMPKCTAPFTISSGKYRLWKDVPTDRPLTIGVSGLGTTTHLVATQLVKKYPQMTVIPFKSTSEALVSTIGGQTDFAVGFVGDVNAWTKDNASKKIVYILGVTGSTPMDKIPTLVSQGFSPDLSTMSSPNHYITSIKMPEEKLQEIREILVKASTANTVLDAYAIDRCVSTSRMPTAEIQPWYHAQAVKWRKLTSGVKVN
jgi:tripartite-type tricarboxylate transporter receptor subunit TctC